MSQFVEKYGVRWPSTLHPLAVEMKAIKYGGQWKRRGGGVAGMGNYFHYRRGMELLWPEIKWHKWNELELKSYLDNTYIGEMGCAAAGKSHTAGSFVLFDWYCFANCTTVLVSSTGLQELELRIFGIIKQYHRLAKERFSWLPGYLIEGKRMITLSHRFESPDGRDFKNGIIGIAARKGSAFVGISGYVGIHNKRIRLVGDELHLMPRSFLDSVSNLSKCEDFKMLGPGNPNDTTNAHGSLCEPAPEIGGWESGIDQTPKTKTWKTRFPNGICIQLPGSDSPNMDAPEDQPPPFPFLMTRQQMSDDAKIWGIDDWHYTMMNDARMPRGQGSRRVLTRQMCEKFRALDAPVWRDSRRTSITFLDAAYRGVGGDRCVFGELQFGFEAETSTEEIIENIVGSYNGQVKNKTIMALIDLLIVPITAEEGSELPEDQIVGFVRKQCEARGVPATNFFFDSGMRTSLVSAFGRTWSPYVNSIDCGGKPTERPVSGGIDVKCVDYYSKYITELWFSVRLCVEAGQFRGLTKDAMWEGCAREWKMVSGNRVEVETKAEMKVKTGRSPDLFDAIAVGVEGARQRGLVISRIADASVDHVDEQWKSELRKKSKNFHRIGQLDYAA